MLLSRDDRISPHSAEAFQFGNISLAAVTTTSTPSNATILKQFASDWMGGW
jgi:hypothetical protein